MQGAKICVIDTRLSNTASMADWWLSPGRARKRRCSSRSRACSCSSAATTATSCAAGSTGRSTCARSGPTFPAPTRASSAPSRSSTRPIRRSSPSARAASPPPPSSRSRARSPGRARRSPRTSGAIPRRATWAAGRWRARCEFLVVLMGAVATPGGTAPGAFNKAVPAPPMMPAPGRVWSELLMPREYPLAFFEMSFLLPHFLKEGRGKLAMYFTRVYNPVWTNPDGLSWVEMLTDEAKVERHACLTPIWSETAWYADYVLPMGHGRRAPRPHVAGNARRALDRLPPAGAARGAAAAGPRVRVDVAGARGGGHRRGVGGGRALDRAVVAHRSRRQPRRPQVLRVAVSPGEKLRIEELYRWIFEHSVPGLPEAAQKEGLTPLAYMRKYGASSSRTACTSARQAGRGEGPRGRLRRSRHQW